MGITHPNGKSWSEKTESPPIKKKPEEKGERKLNIRKATAWHEMTCGLQILQNFDPCRIFDGLPTHVWKHWSTLGALGENILWSASCRPIALPGSSTDKTDISSWGLLPLPQNTRLRVIHGVVKIMCPVEEKKTNSQNNVVMSRHWYYLLQLSVSKLMMNSPLMWMHVFEIIFFVLFYLRTLI